MRFSKAFQIFGALFAVTLPAVACNQVLGIEEATFDPTLVVDASVATDTGPVVDPNSCQAYCATMKTNCTGANQAYTSQATCELVCATFESGVPGETTNDSLACRITHAKDTVADPATTCPKAGALATDCSPDPCSSFCAQASALCKPLNLFQYASVSACKTACAKWPYIKAGDGAIAGDLVFASGNTLNCRLYHLQSAYDPTTPKAADVHCPHTADDSATCN